MLGHEGRDKQTEFAICCTCRALRRRALALVRADPRLSHRIGAQEIAADRVLDHEDGDLASARLEAGLVAKCPAQ
jgi:hypothetical protein